MYKRYTETPYGKEEREEHRKNQRREGEEGGRNVPEAITAAAGVWRI